MNFVSAGISPPGPELEIEKARQFLPSSRFILFGNESMILLDSAIWPKGLIKP